MPKPGGKITRSSAPKKAITSQREAEIIIATWCPDEQAKSPPEQVHLICTVPGLEEYSFIFHFESPDNLAFMIDELTRRRRTVWPDSEKIKGENS